MAATLSISTPGGLIPAVLPGGVVPGLPGGPTGPPPTWTAVLDPWTIREGPERVPSPFKNNPKKIKLKDLNLNFSEVGGGFYFYLRKIK